MPITAPPNNAAVAKVSLIYARDTREEVNTFHVTGEDNLTHSDLVDIANVFQTWWDGSFKQTVGPWITLVQIQVRKLSPSDPQAYDLPVGTAGSAAGGSELPANCTLALSERTGLAGRSQRGRIYHPGIPSNQTDFTRDIISSGYALALLNSLLQLKAAFATSTNALCIFHKADNTYTLVTTFIIDTVLDSQRRRLPGRGR